MLNSLRKFWIWEILMLVDAFHWTEWLILNSSIRWNVSYWSWQSSQAWRVLCFNLTQKQAARKQRNHFTSFWRTHPKTLLESCSAARGDFHLAENRRCSMLHFWVRLVTNALCIPFCKSTLALLLFSVFFPSLPSHKHSPLLLYFYQCTLNSLSPTVSREVCSWPLLLYWLQILPLPTFPCVIGFGFELRKGSFLSSSLVFNSSKQGRFPLCNGEDVQSYYRPLAHCISGTSSKRWVPIQNRTSGSPGSAELAIHGM